MREANKNKTVVSTCQTITCLWWFAANDVVRTNEPWNTHLGHTPGSLLPGCLFQVHLDHGCLQCLVPGNPQSNSMMPHKTRIKRQLQRATRAWTFKVGWTCQTITCLWCFAVNAVVKTFVSLPKGRKNKRTLKHTLGTHARKPLARMPFSGPLKPRLPTMFSTWQSTEQQHHATRNESEKTTPKGLACLNVQSWLNLSNYSCLCCFNDFVKRTLKHTLGTHARKLLARMPLQVH